MDGKSSSLSSRLLEDWSTTNAFFLTVYKKGCKGTAFAISTKKGISTKVKKILN